MKTTTSAVTAATAFIITLAAAAPRASAASLVSDETIKIQKEQTSVRKLKNGIPVIVRAMPGSDILQVNVSFSHGLKDLPAGRKVLNEWLWATVTMGAKEFPKEKVFGLTEQYGLELRCAGMIEQAACGLGTVNDYWDKALPLFAAIIKEPLLTEEDAKLTRERLTAQLKNMASDPGQYINEIVNTIFYPKGHPYRLNHDEALAELAKLSRKDLIAHHQGALNAEGMSIVVVTSLAADKVVADLEGAFGAIKGKKINPPALPAPKFDEKNSYAFNDRELPTAYIRIKLNAPAVRDQDAVATRLLYEILSEELGEEVRTKRSLSYAVHSFVIQYSLGIGVLSASTSKPKETLLAMHDVLQALKTKTYTPEEIEEYKRGFATSYYLTQETHESLAGALASALYHYGDANQHYEMPRLLDKVTPEDIKRLANEILVDPRIGVIFGRKGFDDGWAKDFIKKNTRAAAGAAKKS